MTWPSGVQEPLFDGVAYSVDRSLIDEPWIPDAFMSDDDAWSIINPDEHHNTTRTGPLTTRLAEGW